MKKLSFILSIVGLQLCTSCNNWLDVTPQGQIETENLYQTTRGCNSALGGIYYTFSGSNLYGQTLSTGCLMCSPSIGILLRLLTTCIIKLRNMTMKTRQ